MHADGPGARRRRRGRLVALDVGTLFPASALVHAGAAVREVSRDPFGRSSRDSIASLGGTDPAFVAREACPEICPELSRSDLKSQLSIDLRSP